jgi:cell division topological specificity factor
MSFFDNFFKKNTKSKDNAVNRLKLAITSDRAVCSPDVMEKMQKEIIDVISKYVDIDKEYLDIQLKTIDTEGEGPVNAICANIPIKSENAFRKTENK